MLFLKPKDTKKITIHMYGTSDRNNYLMAWQSEVNQINVCSSQRFTQPNTINALLKDLPEFKIGLTAY